MGYHDNITNTDPYWSELWKDEHVKEYKEAICDRIAEQLITKFTELSKGIFTRGYGGRAGYQSRAGILKSLQKTIRDKELQIGIEKENEPVVIYQSDVEANYEDKLVIDHIVNHFAFKNPMNITLEIQSSPVYGQELELKAHQNVE